MSFVIYLGFTLLEVYNSSQNYDAYNIISSTLSLSVVVQICLDKFRLWRASESFILIIVHIDLITRFSEYIWAGNVDFRGFSYVYCNLYSILEFFFAIMTCLIVLAFDR